MILEGQAGIGRAGQEPRLTAYCNLMRIFIDYPREDRQSIHESLRTAEPLLVLARKVRACGREVMIGDLRAGLASVEAPIARHALVMVIVAALSRFADKPVLVDDWSVRNHLRLQAA